jgi:hypothetical protein
MLCLCRKVSQLWQLRAWIDRNVCEKSQGTGKVCDWLIDCTLHLFRPNSERHFPYRRLLLEQLVVPYKIWGFHSIAGEDSRSPGMWRFVVGRVVEDVRGTVAPSRLWFSSTGRRWRRFDPLERRQSVTCQETFTANCSRSAAEQSHLMLWTQNISYRVNKIPSVLLRQINPVHNVTSSSSNIHFNIIIPSISRLSKRLMMVGSGRKTISTLLYR